MDIDAIGEITAQLPENTRAQNDDISDLDAAISNQELMAEYPDTGDATVEMPAKDDEVTLEMEVGSGKVDTKKKKKAS